MARFQNVNGIDIPLSAEEETARDAEEAIWEEGKPARAMSNLRTRRNDLLASNDWTQAADSPLTDEVKTSWATYRQSLRDLPANTPDPANPTWPTPPE